MTKLDQLPTANIASDFADADMARRIAFERAKTAKHLAKSRLEKTKYGGEIDAMMFPILTMVTSIGLAVVFGAFVIENHPNWVKDHFVFWCAALSAFSTIPLTIAMIIRERRKLRTHQHVENLASTDALTGVLNRRSFTRSLEEDSIGPSSQHQLNAVILFDLDHFKKLNDDYGHEIGDQMLVEVAAIAHSELRNPFDRVGRWGGEEFIVFLHDVSEKTALIACERLRQRISEISIELDGDIISTSASFGGTLMHSAQSLSEVFQQADTALYKAKAKGRNKVEFKRLTAVD